MRAASNNKALIWGRALEEFISKYWPHIVGFVGTIVWAVRLEGRVNYLQKTVDRLEVIAQNQVQAMQSLAVTQSDVQHIKTDIREVKDTLIQMIGSKVCQ